MKCEIPSNHRKQFGIGENFLKSVSILLSKPTFKQVRAMARNLGVDDLRTVEMRKEGAYILGKNLADIDHWKGGSVKNNTIVKKQNSDGELEYFISNKRTDSEPTKWVLDNGRIKPNPYWDYIGKNATIKADGELQRFTRVKTNVYKADDGGETLLKITKPFKGEKVPSNKDLANQGYDAVELSDGSYRVLYENKQAVEGKNATIEINNNAMEAFTKKTSPDDLDEQTVQEQIETLGLGSKVLYGLGGYAAGKLAENWTDSDTNLGWAGGALGVLLSTPKARTKISGIFTGSNANNYAEETRRLTERNSEIDNAKEMTNHGFKGDPRDKEALETYREKVYNSWVALKERGEEAWSGAFRNNYLSSGLSFFRRLGIPAAKDLERKLRGLETFHTTLFRNYSDKIEERFGRKTSLDDFKEYQRDVIREYIQSNNIKGFENVGDTWLEEEMGAAIFRIRTYGSKLDENGRLIWDEDSLTANKIYANEDVADIDRFILENEQGKNIVGVFEDHFNDMAELALKTYDDQFVKELDEMAPEFARLANAIKKSELSIKQWRENLSELVSKPTTQKELIKTYEKAINNPAFQHAIEYHEQSLKIKNLKGRYVPQMRSESKVEQLKKQFMNRPEVRQLTTEAEKAEAWDKHLTDRILEVNRDNYKAFRVSASGDDIEPILKRTENDLLKEYTNNLVYKIQNEEARQRVIRDLTSDSPSTIEKYIGKTLRGENEYYYIKDMQVPLSNGESYRVLDDINRGEIERAQKLFLKMTKLVQSDHLDKPRMYNLPTDMIETNMENVVRRYSIDAGNRLYMHMNGLGTETRLNRQIDKIKKELSDKGVHPDEVAKEISTIKEWYANITRTSDAVEINMDSDDILARYNQRKKNNKLVSTLMNFGYMPFLWFTSFYSLFQPFITGPFMASYGNIWSTYKQFFKNPEEFKTLTDELYKMGAIQKKVKSFSAEMEHHYSKDALSGTDASFLDWIHDLSQRGVEFSANFSLVRKVLDHPSVNIDLEDTGLLRFLGGSMLDISGAESALTTMATFREIENLVEAGSKLLNDRSLRQASAGGVTYRLGDIRRKLEEFGVDNPDTFIENSVKINKTFTSEGEVSQIGTYIKKITGGTDDGTEIPASLVSEYNRIADTVVNQLHGRTRFSRPLKWTNNPYGRLLSQFSVYSQNFAVQTVMQRIYVPIKSWIDTYNPDSSLSMMKVMWHMKQGNDKALKKMFGDNWERAYDDFPVDAFNNAFRVMPVVMGTGAVMGATRDTVMDFVNLMGATVTGDDDFEAWKRTRENSETMKQYVSGDKTGYDIIKMARDVAHLGVDMGFTGRAGQIFINESRYQQGGLWSKTPVTGMLNDFYEASTTPFRVAPEDILPSTSKAVAEEILLRTPIIGSFNDFRSSLINAVFQKPKNRDVKFFNSENSAPIDSINIDAI